MENSKPARHVDSSRVIPPRPISQVARDAINTIEQAISNFVAWGVTINDGSRLHQAREILADAEETGLLVPSHRGDLLGLRALELAFDYAAIAETLPATPLASMRRELHDSLKGNIDPPETSRGPSQLQSQAIVRAAFVRAGLSPLHPTHSSQLGLSSPDLLLENGSIRYAIEAKRPQKSKNILPRFIEGCGQVAKYGLRGGVLVDVSDCVRGLNREEISAEVSQGALGLREEVFRAGRGHRSGYEHIMLAGVYARVAWTSDDGPVHAMVSVHITSEIGIFAAAPNTLVDHRARWIRSHFQEGLHLLTPGASQ